MKTTSPKARARYKQERLFWVIDQIGRIHLRVKRDPDAAIAFFEKAINDARLSEIEDDDMAAWITAAKDWKKFGKKPTSMTSESALFNSGKKLYDKGVSQKKYPGDDAGNGYFSIAETYLIPMITSFDDSKKMPDALYMMGDIKKNLRIDVEYWNDNYYLKEVIRRFPHTPIT